jgi:hypothetical protein
MGRAERSKAVLVSHVSPEHRTDDGDPIAPGDRRDDALRGLVEDLENRTPSDYWRRVTSLEKLFARAPERQRLLQLWSFAVYELRTKETIVTDEPPNEFLGSAPCEPWEKRFVTMAQAYLLVRRGQSDELAKDWLPGSEHVVRFITINAATDKAEWRHLRFHLRQGSGYVVPHATRALLRHCTGSFSVALGRAYEYATTCDNRLRQKDAICWATDPGNEPADVEIKGGSASAAFTFGLLSAQRDGVRDDILVLGEVDGARADVRGLGKSVIATKLGLLARESIDYVVVFNSDERDSAEQVRAQSGAAWRVCQPTEDWGHPVASIFDHCPRRRPSVGAPRQTPSGPWGLWRIDRRAVQTIFSVVVLIGASLLFWPRLHERLPPHAASERVLQDVPSEPSTTTTAEPRGVRPAQDAVESPPSPGSAPDAAALPVASTTAARHSEKAPAFATTGGAAVPAATGQGAKDTRTTRDDDLDALSGSPRAERARAHDTLCGLLRSAEGVARRDHFQAYVDTLPGNADEPEQHPCFQWQERASQRSFSAAERRAAAAACECP